MMFLRFVVGGEDEGHRQLTGLITEARLLRDQGALIAYEEELLQSTYDWFNKHLPCPPFESAGWSREAVSWFKDSALAPIHRMRRHQSCKTPNTKLLMAASQRNL